MACSEAIPGFEPAYERYYADANSRSTNSPSPEGLVRTVKGFSDLMQVIVELASEKKQKPTVSSGTLL
jgi:hypothetical protein